LGFLTFLILRASAPPREVILPPRIVVVVEADGVVAEADEVVDEPPRVVRRQVVARGAEVDPHETQRDAGTVFELEMLAARDYAAVFAAWSVGETESREIKSTTGCHHRARRRRNPVGRPT
jgi:hypothetical protein